MQTSPLLRLLLRVLLPCIQEVMIARRALRRDANVLKAGVQCRTCSVVHRASMQRGAPCLHAGGGPNLARDGRPLEGRSIARGASGGNGAQDVYATIV